MKKMIIQVKKDKDILLRDFSEIIIVFVIVLRL